MVDVPAHLPQRHATLQGQGEETGLPGGPVVAQENFEGAYLLSLIF